MRFILLYSILLFIVANNCFAQDNRPNIIYGENKGEKMQHVIEQYKIKKREKDLGVGNWDTIPMLLFKVNPLLMVSQLEFGGLFEYHLRKRFSVEAGGGVHVPKGFTIRTGVRFYSKSGLYFNPEIFYRYKIYHNRHYQWNRDGQLSGILETQPLLDFSGTDFYYKETANENKQVFAMQLLFGRESLWLKRFLIDKYFGIGCRYKYRQKEISYQYSNAGHISTYYSPLKEEIVKGFFPSVQAGIRIGISCN